MPENIKNNYHYFLIYFYFICTESLNNVIFPYHIIIKFYIFKNYGTVLIKILLNYVIYTFALFFPIIIVSCIKSLCSYVA